MGKGLFSKVKHTVVGYPAVNYLILGPKGAGKTTALLKWKYPEESILIVPSIGLNLETIDYKEKSITFYDVSVGDKYVLPKAVGERPKSPVKKPLDSKFKFSPNKTDGEEDELKIDDFNIEGIIFFVDSYEMKDDYYSKEALEMMDSILEIQKYCLLPVLIFANKQDLADSLTTEEIAQKLNLYGIRNRKWFIRESNCKKGIGLNEGLDWLLSNVSSIE